MVDKIKKQGKEALVTTEAIWNVLILLSELSAAIVMSVYAMTLRDMPWLLAGTCVIAVLLATDVIVKLFRLQKATY